MEKKMYRTNPIVPPSNAQRAAQTSRPNDKQPSDLESIILLRSTLTRVLQDSINTLQELAGEVDESVRQHGASLGLARVASLLTEQLQSARDRLQAVQAAPLHIWISAMKRLPGKLQASKRGSPNLPPVSRAALRRALEE